MRILRGLGAPPSVLDQAAASLVVALDSTPAGFASEAAVDLLLRFDPLDRTIIGVKAVALGADAASVSQSIAHTINDTPVETPPIIAPPPSPPVFVPGQSINVFAPYYRKYWIGGGIAAVLGYLWWRHRRAG